MQTKLSTTSVLKKTQALDLGLKKKKKKRSIEEVTDKPKKKKKKAKHKEEVADKPKKKKKKAKQEKEEGGSKGLIQQLRKARKDLDLTVPEDSEDDMSPADRIKVRRLKRKLKHLKSAFKHDVPEINRLIGKGDYTTSTRMIHSALLAMLIENIPTAEAQYRERPGQSTAYAMNGLISQAREILADIQAEASSSELAQKICTDMLHPAFLALAHHLTQGIYHLREQLLPMVKEHTAKQLVEIINTAAIEMGKFTEAQYNSLREKVYESMVND